MAPSRLIRAVKTVIKPSSYPYRDPGQWESHYYIDLASIVSNNHAKIFHHPTTTAFHGLVALDGRIDSEAARAAAWLCEAADDTGRIWIDDAIPRHFHTNRGRWYSGMTQGLAVSLLVRLYDRTGEPWAADGARSLAAPLFRTMSEGGCLATVGRHGLFIEEICAPPATHVLNGAVFGYWGMHDLVQGGLADVQQVGRAEEVGQFLVEELRDYQLPLNWSKYDLVNATVASREYQRLHAVQARVLAQQAASQEASRIAAAWASADNLALATWYSLCKGSQEIVMRLRKNPKASTVAAT